ncbi:MAG TPA: hypothetical protein HA306_01205 [Methanosarcina sp.]|nr:hypothetical protein [Methanosarcina sp.]
MLDWKTDRERALDIATKTAIPFFIFAPPDFTQDLAQAMRSLYLNTISNTSKSAFDESLNIFEALIENAPGRVAAYHYTDIIGYQSRYDNLSDKFRTILEKLAELEKRSKTQEKQINHLYKKDKKIETLNNNLVSCLPEIKQNSNNYSRKVDTDIQKVDTDSQKVDTDRQKVTKLSYSSAVIACLKSATSPLTNKEIIEQSGLAPKNVNGALINLNKTHKINLRVEYRKIDVFYNSGKYKGQTRKTKIAYYSWIENPEENLSSNDKKIKWVLPLYSQV